jgi:hypothetical protein
MTFSQFIKLFKSMWGGAVIAATAGPSVLWLSGLDPPWPPGSASKIATLFCAVAAIMAYALGNALSDNKLKIFKNNSFLKRQSHGIVGTVFLMVGLIMGIAYLWTYSSVVVADTIQIQSKNVVVRKVVGDEIRDGVITDGKTKLDLLRDHLYEEDRVWTPESLKAARMTLLTTFLTTFVCITFGTAILAFSYPGKKESSLAQQEK